MRPRETTKTLELFAFLTEDSVEGGIIGAAVVPKARFLPIVVVSPLKRLNLPLYALSALALFPSA